MAKFAIPALLLWNGMSLRGGYNCNDFSFLVYGVEDDVTLRGEHNKTVLRKHPNCYGL